MALGQGCTFFLVSVALQSTLSGPYHGWVPSGHTVSHQGPRVGGGTKATPPEEPRAEERRSSERVPHQYTCVPEPAGPESDPRWAAMTSRARHPEPGATSPWLPLQACALPLSVHRRPAEDGGATGQTALRNMQGGLLLFRGPGPLLLGPDGSRCPDHCRGQHRRRAGPVERAHLSRRRPSPAAAA